MSNCTSIAINGINSFCNTSVGGIVEVYAIPGDYIDSVQTGTGNTADFESAVSGVVTGVTYHSGATTASTSDWVLYKFRKNSSSMNKSYSFDDATGYAAYETQLTMLFTRMDAAKRAELVALAKGGARFIVKDSNGHYWFLGADEEVTVSELTGQTGQQKTDGNYYQVVLTDTSKELPYECDKTFAETIANAANS